MEKIQHLRIPLEEIKLATKNFSKDNLIARGGFGAVYKGNLTTSGQEKTVAVKRLDRKHGQGDREFMMEIQLLSCYKHKNLVVLVGFCQESKENILVYMHAKYGSLDRYLGNDKLSWMQRLIISLGAARGVRYLHNDVGLQHRVLHRDLKSSNILLDENWEAKVADFGLSKIGPANTDYTFLATNPCGTRGYIDPEYQKTYILTKESDVYSFGVVLFEILCGRLALINTIHNDQRILALLAQRSCEENRLYDIILPGIKNEMSTGSLNVFSTVAYQCLKEKRTERPTMTWIVEKLEKALELQVNRKVYGFIRVGIWGKQSEDPQNNWAFEFELGHKLKNISIGYANDVIHSLMFTTECRGVMHTSNRVGGSAGGDKVSEVTFNFDEEIVSFNGSIDTQGSDTIISSLSFITNKRTFGPFGRVSKSVFSIPLDQDSLVGFYGTARHYLDGIGVYVKPHDEILRVGTWGRPHGIEGPLNIWSFELEENHHLQKIIIDHGDLIYSLMFTTQYRGSTYTSRKSGGWNGGETISEVTFDWNEEIVAFSGTVSLSRGPYANITIISSLSFVTNKKTHGPFGDVRGTPFTVSWDDGAFAGFYGLCGYYIDSIGVCLNAPK